MKAQFYTNVLVDCGTNPAAEKPAKRRKGEAKKAIIVQAGNFNSPDSCQVRGHAASYLRHTPAP
ncbi:MAG: hypothetical protein JWP88_2080 [Flaviaesturariibacter sp.]|nr:hypothetical protein [Flaviaesturariibacter sp.]